MLFPILIQELLAQARSYLAEKLAPKPQESPEAKALKEIQAFTEGLSSRYSQKIEVREIFDPISKILAPFSPENTDPPTSHRLYTLPRLVTEAISANTPGIWQHSVILSPTSLWYVDDLIQTGIFRRVYPHEPFRYGDIVVTDSRYGLGGGTAGLYIDATDTDYRLLTNSDNYAGRLKYIHVAKTSVLGAYRPLPPIPSLPSSS